MGRMYCGRGFSFLVGCLLLVLQQSDRITAQRSVNLKSSHWLTFSGNAPIVIAKGGFSGIFPDSSAMAYNFALDGSPDAMLWCDVQLTKDGAGICLPDIKLNNCSDITAVYTEGQKVYHVNGVPATGWFSVDYTLYDLSKISLTQGVYSRSEKFDRMNSVLTVEDVITQFKPSGLWLNIQHDIFYQQHNLSMKSYVLSVSRHMVINYISSPEVAFLSSIAAKFKGSKTKLVFQFLSEDIKEQSTKETYGSLLQNLTFIKSFASGILVPKSYIWPVNSNLYLQPYTSLVLDAHREGIEVFTSGFANDALLSYNYSYDPMAEYLAFIDNGHFSVDGVLSDFPSTASGAIGCFSHIDKNNSGHGKPVIISHNGASGVYPGCTDLAYQKAVEDGADFIDCSVQVTKDGILICLSSINLIDSTTVTRSPYSSRTSVVPEIKRTPGIFTFNLTWQEIQMNLKPAISNPEIKYRLVRNPAYENAGNFMTLSDFLAFAKAETLSGVLVNIEHAAFVAEKLGIHIADAVLNALTDLGYNSGTDQEVMIQSTSRAVLTKFKQQTKYKLMYKIDKPVQDIISPPIQDIKQFAHSVAISKQSIYTEKLAFVTGTTDLVEKLQSANLSVYVYLLRNEFVSQAWDFLSDATMEINAFVKGVGVDGVITEFPGTASAYRRTSCLNSGDGTPNYMSPVQPGYLMQLIPNQSMPQGSWSLLPNNQTVALFD